MSFRADFRAYVFDPNGLKETYTVGSLNGFRVTGSVTYAISPTVATTAYLDEWKHPDKRSFMVGLYVDSTQTVEVDYEDATGGNLRLKEDAGVAAQLASNFGEGANKKWIGLMHPGGGQQWKLDTSQVAAGFASFKIRVGIYPADGPQFIPVVARHRRGFNSATGQFTAGDFKDGHIAGVWYVPAVSVSAEGKQFVCGPRGIEWLDKGNPK